MLRIHVSRPQLFNRYPVLKIQATTSRVQYLHARRVLESGQGGDLDRIEFSAIYFF